MTFDETGMSLHRHSETPSEDAVLFTHGLGGSGSGTWLDFPAYLFDSSAKLDVAAFDYRTALRRLGWSRPTISGLSFYDGQLVAGIRELKAYQRIHLVGHSLGGVMNDAALKRMVQDPQQGTARPLHQLASITYFASPRAGTGLAIPGVRHLLPELRALKRFSKKGNAVADFFTKEMTSDLRDPAADHRVWLPRFACIAGSEAFVSEYSATFAIPDGQQLRLNGTHESIVKPETATAPQITWVLDNIGQVIAARQRINEQQYRARRAPRAVRGRSTLVTEYWGHQSGQWESEYNDARRESSTGAIAVEDHRDMPHGTAIDLLIAVSDAAEVVAGSQRDEQNARDAASRARAEYDLTVGLATVGDEHIEAVPVINEWITSEAPRTVMVRGAKDSRELKFALSDWIQNVVRRDPRGRPLTTAARTAMTVLEQPGQIGDLS